MTGLDTRLLRKAYTGGQLEVQNANEGYLYQGEIADASFEYNELRVRLSWNAKGEGFSAKSPIPHKWINDGHLEYVANLQIYNLIDVGEERICLNSPILGETTVLFPKNGSKLDPSKVEGLVL